MQICFSRHFSISLNAILDYIAQHSPSNAESFYNELMARIHALPSSPKAYRKNPQINQEDIRDLIYKGYVIPFAIAKDCITILAIYKSNLWKSTTFKK